MSIAYSVPTIRIRVSPKLHSSIIRSSNADGPLRRPVAPAPPTASPPPSLKPPPSLSTPTADPAKPISSSSPSQSPPKPAAAAGAVTLEYQRKMAKELQDYFRQKKLEEANQGPFFGFVAKNEIANGRWAMFGFAVGLLTEYATGSDFVQQLKILFSNFGIVDLD